jgi:hypothetical protein
MDFGGPLSPLLLPLLLLLLLPPLPLLLPDDRMLSHWSSQCMRLLRRASLERKTCGRHTWFPQGQHPSVSGQVSGA